MLKQLRLTVFAKAILIAHFFVVPAHGMLSSRLANQFIRPVLSKLVVRPGVEKILNRFLPKPRLTQSVMPSIPRKLLQNNQRLIHTQRKLCQKKPTQSKLPTRRVVKPCQGRVMQKPRTTYQAVNRFELGHSSWSKNNFMLTMLYGGIGPAVGLGIVAGSKIVAIGKESSSIVESIIYEKELFKKIEQNDDSIIPMLEKVFVTKEKSELAEKVFKKLIETNWGTKCLDSLLKTNPDVAILFTSVLTADANNIVQLDKNSYGSSNGIYFFIHLMEEDPGLVKQVTSVLAADANNIIQLCNSWFIGTLMEKDSNAAKLFTSVLVEDANNLVKLCKNMGLLHLFKFCFLKRLMEKDPNSAKQFISVLVKDTNSLFKLCKNFGGTHFLEDLMEEDPRFVKQVTSVLAANVNNIAELFKDSGVICFLKRLMKKDSNAAKLLISVLVADTNNIVQLFKDLSGEKYLFGIYLLRDLMEEDPRLVKQVTSVLAADTNNIAKLLKNSQGIYLFRDLIEKDSNAAKLLISVLAADTNLIVQLCNNLDDGENWTDSKRLDGIYLLRDLMEEDSSAAKQVIFETLITDASFDLCKEPRGRKFLKFLIDKNSSMFSQLPDTIVCKMPPYLFYLFTEKGSCGDIKDLVEKMDGDNLGSLFKQLIYCDKCKKNQAVGTQTSIDMKQNLNKIIKSSIVNVLQKPLVKKMLDGVFKKEQALQSDYYTFLHGQRWAVVLPERWFTWLWSLKNNQSCKDFLFCHVEKPKDNENQLIQEEELRKEVLDKGGECDIDVQSDNLQFNRLQFLTWSLFGNSTNLASNSVNYSVYNHNCNDHRNRIKRISIKSAFEDLGFAHIYEKYKNQLDNLEQEHKNLSEHGQMLLFAIPKDKIEDCVFPVDDYGCKDEVFIDGLGYRNDISIIMETLRSNPEKINYNNLQFALVKTWDFALNPEKSGIKVFPFDATDTDSEKVKKFRAKEEELFRQIKQDIMNARLAS